MKLTPEARDAMLAEYESGADPLPLLAERWGVSLSTINTYRRRAGLSRRVAVYRNVEPVDISVHLLPVYPVRLVSRPGEEGPGRGYLEPVSVRDVVAAVLQEEGGDDGRS